MTDYLDSAIQALLNRAEQNGSQCSLAEFEVLNRDFGAVFPDWYVACLTQHPLADLHLGWQAFPPDDDFDGMTWLVLSDTAMLRELLISYPAMYLFDRGFFPIANDSTNAGNVFVMETSTGPDSPVYEVWHDISHDPDELVAAIRSGKSGGTVTPSFANFLANCPVDGPYE